MTVVIMELYRATLGTHRRDLECIPIRTRRARGIWRRPPDAQCATPRIKLRVAPVTATSNHGRTACEARAQGAPVSQLRRRCGARAARRLRRAAAADAGRGGGASVAAL